MMPTFKKTGEFNIPVKEGWGNDHRWDNLIHERRQQHISYVDPSAQTGKSGGSDRQQRARNNINELS